MIYVSTFKISREWHHHVSEKESITYFLNVNVSCIFSSKEICQELAKLDL